MYSLELTAINKILINKGFINIVINDILKESKLDVKRKALFTRIVYGVVENKILLDYQISFYLEKDSLPKEVKNLLRMATYMVLYMNLSNHHVVLEIVEMVKKLSPNYTSLFNGILRNITRNQEQEVYFDDYNRLLSVKYSYPISLISLLKKQYPDMIEDILKHDSETYNVYRINTLKTTIEFIKEDLKDYEFEFVDKINNISFYNDSKATNCESTKIALKSFNQPTLLILGGLDRGHSFDDLTPCMGNVNYVACYGETKSRIKEYCDRIGVSCGVFDTLVNATNACYEKATKGDVVLLSPACASWDQYKKFEDRGDEFKNTIKGFKGE